MGALLFAAAFVALPMAMYLGHGRRHRDSAAVAGDVLLGAAWVLFVWSVLGQLLNLALVITGVGDPLRSRVVAGFVVAVVVALLIWGYRQAMRVPRIRRVDVTIDGLGRGLDGLRVAVITDTHYGPIDRSRWSAGVVARVNELDADIVCHVGDIADGTVDVREEQARPLGVGAGHVGPGLRHRQPRILQRGAGLARLHGEHRLGGAAQPAHRRRARRRPPGRRGRGRRHRRGSGVRRTRR